MCQANPETLNQNLCAIMRMLGQVFYGNELLDVIFLVYENMHDLSDAMNAIEITYNISRTLFVLSPLEYQEYLCITSVHES